MATNKPDDVEPEKPDEVEAPDDSGDEVDLEDDETNAEDMLKDEPDDDDSEDDSDDDESDDEDSDDGEPDESSDAEEEEDAEEPDEEPEKPADSNPAANAFKQREEERKLRQQRQELEDERLDDYIKGAGEDEVEKQKRQNEVVAYRQRKREIELNEQQLINGANQALREIDIFKSGSKAEKEAMLEAVEDFERQYVERDKDGNPIKVNGDVFEFLQKKADSIRRLTGVGARKQSKAKAKTKSRTLAAPSRKPKEPKADPMLDGFDEEASRY